MTISYITRLGEIQVLQFSYRYMYNTITGVRLVQVRQL